MDVLGSNHLAKIILGNYVAKSSKRGDFFGNFGGPGALEKQKKQAEEKESS